MIGKMVKMVHRSPTPQELAHLKRKETYGKIRAGIMIFDCTLRSREKCSEGEFLKEYIRILNRQLEQAKKEKPVDVYLRYVLSATRSPNSLKMWLKYAYTQTIHISAHGGSDEVTGETFLEVGNGRFELKDLKDIWSEFPKDERPLLIVLSACSAGHLDLIKAFSDEGCRYCIAPVFGTDWEKAALFSALFYTYLFYEQTRPVTAFQKAKTRLPELTGWWKIFDYGKELP